MKTRRVVLWTAGGIVAVILLAGVTVVMLLDHSHKFHAYLLQRIERVINESTGARVAIRDFKVTLSGLQVDFEGIVLHGKEPSSQRPLLAADHLGIAIKIDSVLGGKWHLRSVTADHPVAYFSVDKTGESNLPVPNQPSQTHTNVFELAVAQAAVHRGEIYYNDQKMSVDALLKDLEFGAAFDPSQSRYRGSLRYDNGSIHYGNYMPVAHSLNANFEVTPKTFTLNHAQITAGSSRIVLEATVEDYASKPRLQATYDALVATRDVGRILIESSVPSGDVRLTGTLNYQSRPDRLMIENLKLAGTASSGDLLVATSGVHTALHDVRARYTLEDGNTTVDGLHFELFGGSLDGVLAVHDISGAQKGSLRAMLHGVSLDQALSRNRALQQARLSGRVDADVEASWTTSLKSLVAHGNAVLEGTFGNHPRSPVNGEVHADYKLATQQVALHRSYLRTSHTSIILDGKISNNSQLQVRMISGDLHEIELLAANFQAATEGGSAQAPMNLGLYGNGRLTATVGGSLDSPQIRGAVEATNLRVKGSSWRTLRADVSANPSSLALENGEVQASTRGSVAFNIHAGLAHWSYLPASPINVTVSGSQLSVADLEKIAGKTYPVTGTLAINVSLRGSRLNPVGQGSITLANGAVANQPIQNVGLTFHGDGNSVDMNLDAHVAAGSAKGEARVDPKTGGYNFELHVAGLRLENLQAAKERNLDLSGVVNLDASGKGTTEKPELEAALTMPELHFWKQTVRNSTLHAALQNQAATISLDSNAEGASIKGNGTIGIKAPYMVDMRLDTSRIELQRLVGLYSPAQSGNVGGQTELHVVLRGPLQDKTRMEAHLEIPTLAATYKQFQIGSTKPIHIDYQNGTAVLQPVALEGTDTTINMQATIPVSNPNAATLVLKGVVDLRVAQLLVADLKSSGQIRFDIDSRGTGLGAGMSGQISIVDASVHPPDIPIGLDHANGTIKVTPTRLDISSFKGEMGGGTITAKGGMTIRPALQFDLGLEGDKVRLRYPEGIRALLGTSLALTGTPQGAVLSGRVGIEHLSFTPDFDLSSFTRQFEETSAPATTGGFAQDLRLNIALQSTAQMNLQSSQVSLQGNANLRVVGTAAQPVVLGRSNLAGGELFFGGNRYVVQSGTVDFLNPVRTEPVLNLQVQTRINDFNITLGLQGPVTRLHTTYTSDPALPPADIINLIARGQTTEAAGAQPSQPLSLGAQSLVASAVSGQIGNKIAKVAGISQLQIDPSLGTSNGQNPGARIAIQQRVTSNFFMTISTDVTSTQRQSIQLEYNFNSHWSVSGVRDQNGGVTALGHYKKKF